MYTHTYICHIYLIRDYINIDISIFLFCLTLTVQVKSNNINIYIMDLHISPFFQKVVAASSLKKVYVRSNIPKLYKTSQNCTLNTIHYRGNIHHFFYIFGYLLFFPKYMKNKIGILENDIYIFPIVNSVICEVHSFD